MKMKRIEMKKIFSEYEVKYPYSNSQKMNSIYATESSNVREINVKASTVTTSSFGYTTQPRQAISGWQTSSNAMPMVIQNAQSQFLHPMQYQQQQNFMKNVEDVNVKQENGATWAYRNANGPQLPPFSAISKFLGQ